MEGETVVADTEGQKSFPRIPAKNWWELRRRFAQTLPKAADEDYLQAVLGLTSSRSAANLIAPLRTVGLIDEDNHPTDRANDWRSDEHYSDVCKQILDEVYPSNLRDLFLPPKPDFEGVKAWFSRNTKVGNSTANAMASFYVLIAEGDSSGGSRIVAKAKPTSRTTPSPRAASKATSTVKAESERTRMDQGKQERKISDQEWPTVHIDVQIHIAADASAEQIDALFESMAKHLYQRS